MEAHIHASFFSDWGSCGETRDGSRPVGGPGLSPRPPTPWAAPRILREALEKGKKRGRTPPTLAPASQMRLHPDPLFHLFDPVDPGPEAGQLLLQPLVPPVQVFQTVDDRLALGGQPRDDQARPLA